MDTDEASISVASHRNRDDEDVVASPEMDQVAAVLDDMIQRRVKIVNHDATQASPSAIIETEDTGIRLFKMSRCLLKCGDDEQKKDGNVTTQTNGNVRKHFVRKRRRCDSSSDESSDDEETKLKLSAVSSDWVMKSAAFSTVLK